MKKLSPLVSIILLLIFPNCLQGQQLLIDFPFEYDYPANTIIPVFNKDSSEVYLVYQRDEKIDIHILDSSFTNYQQHSFQIEKGFKNFEIVKAINNQENLLVLLANSSTNKFLAVECNFETKLTTTFDYKVDSDQQYLSSIILNRNIYSVFIKKDGSTLWFHEFGLSQNQNIIEIEPNYIVYQQEVEDLHHAIELYGYMFIENKNSNLNSDTSPKIKFIIEDNFIYLTNDISINKTVICKLDIDKATSVRKNYKINKERFFTIDKYKTASMISDSLLIQAALWKEGFDLTFIDLNQDSIITYKHLNLSNKNMYWDSLILRKGTKIIDKESFLQNSASNELFVSVNKGNNLQLELGSRPPGLSTGGALLTGALGGLIGTAIVYGISESQRDNNIRTALITLDSNFSLSESKEPKIYMGSISNFENLLGKEYKKDPDYFIKLKCGFFLNNLYIHCFYNEKTDKYEVRRFNL